MVTTTTKNKRRAKTVAKKKSKKRAKPATTVDRSDKAGAADTLPRRTSRAATATADDTLELIEVASENTMAASPLVGIHTHEVAEAAKALFRVVTKTPRRAGSQLGHFAKELRSIITGDSDLTADPQDRRYADPAWKENFIFRRFMQTHVAAQKDLFDYIDAADMSPMEKGRAHFFASQVADAFSPANFPLTNPAAMRKTLDTGGKNLVRGAKNLYHDMRYNNMMPSMVDATSFEVGVNMATQPGSVVFRHDMFELIQYTPTTPKVYARPLLMTPPQVNKFYVADLTPEKSLFKWIVDSGVQLFVISWKNPTALHRDWGLNEFCHAIDAAVDTAREITGSADVNMLGSCSGGMTQAAYLGWQAARGETKVANTSWTVCILNTEAALEDSTLALFNSPENLKIAKARSRRRGIVSGEEMASMFAWMRPNDLIWNYWVNNYLMGNKPPAFDLLAWNIDTTRLAGQFHCDLLDMVDKNPYINPNTLEINGESIDFRQVSHGAYVIGGITDHITPWRGCYGTARLFGKDTTFVLVNSGHIQTMVNPPGTRKSFFIAAKADQDNPDTWAKKHAAKRTEGSWWPHWRQWLQARSGDEIAAPTVAGSRKNKVLCAAPGQYVLEK